MNDIVARCMKCEYVVVVGAEDLYYGSSRHNKMMFAQSAVRYVQKYAWRFDRTTVFYFKGKCSASLKSQDGDEETGQNYFRDGYTDAQIEAMKASIERYGGICDEAKTWSDVANHVNNVNDKIDECEKRVQVLIFFCHGTPNKIWLSNSESKYLQFNNLALINPNSFLPESGLTGRKYPSRHVTSWACQTANSGNSALSNEENMSQSLAQKMADAWDIQVRASATRTVYSAVFSGGFGGLMDDWFGDRRIVDGVLWEDDGADGSVKSGTGTDTRNVSQGMWVFNPGQTSGYDTGNFD